MSDEKNSKEMDDVIKNPSRLASSLRQQKKYEPEYVSLNKEPIIKDSVIVSVDDLIFDEDNQKIDIPKGHIVDNNDYVSFGFPSVTPAPTTSTDDSAVTLPDSPKVGDYILMVFGKLITSGSFADIELRVKNIIYGEDESFSGVEVSADDIVVLKRIAIKIGVFLDE